MIGVNLLPWRDIQCEERKKTFLITLVLVSVVAGLILLLADRFLSSAINAQNRRNQYLNEQIAILDRQVEEVRELRRRKQALTEHMAVIQDLQGGRPLIVRLFDEVVRSLPEGVYYESINRSGDTLRLEGVAESNSRISVLMRKLADSDWFADPGLQQVTADNRAEAEETDRNHFQLTAAVIRPKQEQAR